MYSVYSRILQAGLVKGRPREPIALKTELGWLISGSACQKKVKKAGIPTTIPGNTKLEEFLGQTLAQVRGLCKVDGLKLKTFLAYKSTRSLFNRCLHLARIFAGKNG